MTEPSNSDWYKSAFGELYPLIYAHRDDQAAAAEIASLIHWFALHDSGARTLDLCCGDGRHSRQLSTMGLDVMGIDLSESLLERAATGSALTGRLIRGDMRRLPFSSDFDLVLNLFTSFGYFLNESENLATLTEMTRILRPGGRLVIDHINRDWVEATFVAEDERAGPDCTIRQQRTIDDDRVRKQITVTWQDGRTIRQYENVRMYRPAEMTQMLTTAGMERIEFYGDYSGAPLGEQSRRLIVTAVRPN